MSRDASPMVRDVAEGGEYSWAHRAFLQAFQTHSVMTVDEIKPVLANILTVHNPERPYTTGDITQPQITNHIQLINARLAPFDYEIRSTRDQHTKSTVYALINSTSDALTQLATRFTPSEIAYVRRLLDCMFDTNNTHSREVMALKHTEASQLARPSRRGRHSQANGHGEDGEASQAAVDTGISIAEADGILETLVHDAFFQKSRAGYFSLAPRALMELRTYLKETYNDEEEVDAGDVKIRDCEGCREIVTFGIRCNDRNCGVRWHDACANSYYRGRSRENRTCPKCETVCSGDVYVGERVITASAAARGRGRSERHEEDEEEDDE
ncbi:hypothetical protein ACN47E_009755 [Coniothyrium glycines]